jgi:hypothetical protein
MEFTCSHSNKTIEKNNDIEVNLHKIDNKLEINDDTSDDEDGILNVFFFVLI